MATRLPIMRLNNADLPTFGRPTIAISPGIGLRWSRGTLGESPFLPSPSSDCFSHQTDRPLARSSPAEVNVIVADTLGIGTRGQAIAPARVRRFHRTSSSFDLDRRRTGMGCRI